MILDNGDTRLILRTCARHGLLRNQAAYVLGTTSWETGQTMKPVRETFASTPEQAQARLEAAWKRGKLPWVSRPYWRTGYFGRGYVQLTHEANYQRAGLELGLDLVSEPFRALEPDTAAEILVRGMRDGWFTGKRLEDYLTLEKSNYRGARRIVNGTDRATVIAELAREYEHALEAEGYGLEAPAPVVNERRDGSAPRETRLKSKTLRAQFLQWLAALSPSAIGWWQAEAPMLKLAIIASVVVIAVTGAVIWRERLQKWDWGIR